MIRFKNRSSGLSLIEVVLTIAFLGMVLTPSSVVQRAIIRIVFDAADSVERGVLLESTLHERLFHMREQEHTKKDLKAFVFEKKVENPHTTIVYTLEEPHESSSLKKFHNLYVAKVHGSWSRAGFARDDRMVTLLYHPFDEGGAS